MKKKKKKDIQFLIIFFFYGNFLKMRWYEFLQHQHLKSDSVIYTCEEQIVLKKTCTYHVLRNTCHFFNSGIVKTPATKFVKKICSLFLNER